MDQAPPEELTLTIIAACCVTFLAIIFIKHKIPGDTASDTNLCCPLGFKSKRQETSVCKNQSLVYLTIPELEQCDKTLRYVALGGSIFAAKPYSKFLNSSCWSRDITTAVIRSDSIEDRRINVSKLSFSQQKVLDKWYQRCLAECVLVGYIIVNDKPASKDLSLKLHKAIETNDLTSIKQILERAGHSVSTLKCPRTNLSPLHKAIECQNQKAVDIIFAKDSIKQDVASLYGNESTAELCKRFNIKCPW